MARGADKCGLIKASGAERRENCRASGLSVRVHLGYAAGVPISIITDAPVTPLERLPMCAGFAVSEGLPYDEGWRAITINPAKQTGIGDRVGSLEAGKDGDVVIWEADPLTVIGTSAYMTVVDGKIVYRAE